MESRPTRRVSDDGFTLVEVIAAIVVLAILATGVAAVLSQSLQASRTSRQRVAAANLVAAQMDLIRNANSADLDIGTSASDSPPVDSTIYHLTQSVRWVSGPAALTDSCSGTGSTLYKSVAISATWPNMNGTQPVRSDTVVTPDIGDVGANAITIPIRVRDRDNVVEPGVSVTLTGTGVSTSQITDDFGCVVFADIPAGSYTATTTSTTSPATVNWQGASSNSVTVGSSVGGSWLSTTEFQWDTAASLTLTPTGPDSSHLVPPGVGAAIANTNLTSLNGSLYYATTPGSATASNLFPFSNGYESWAGSCADADPKASANNRNTPTIVAPGGSANVALTTQAVNVTVTMKSPKVNLGQTVVAVHGNDAGCPSGMTVTLGTTNAAGMVTAALPYGSWSFRVSSATPNTTWPTKALTPSATPTAVAVSAQ